jgi:hypothetical protein
LFKSWAKADQTALERCLDAIEAPCSRREENQLRAVFQQEHASHGAKARAIIDVAENLGLQPFQPPPPLPPIRAEEVNLVCWLAIESKT